MNQSLLVENHKLWRRPLLRLFLNFLVFALLACAPLTVYQRALVHFKLLGRDSPGPRDQFFLLENCP